MAKKRVESSRVATVLLLVLCALGSSAGTLRAQSGDASRITAGDAVRLRTDGGLTVEAAFRSWEGPSLLLDVDGLSGLWTVEIYDVRTLEVFTERTRQEGFRHGAVLGGVTGLFVGAAAGAALNLGGVIDDPGKPSKVVNQAVTGAVIGAALGALGMGMYRGRNPGRGWIGVEIPDRPEG